MCSSDLYHTGWDQHATIEKDHRRQCAAVDQGAAALLVDLNVRGFLDEDRKSVAKGKSVGLAGRRGIERRIENLETGQLRTEIL